MATFDLVIFDLDGTLVDSLPDIAAALNHVLRRAGMSPLPLAQVGGYVGDGAAKLVQRALPHGAAPERFEALLADFRTTYAQHLVVETRPYPGVESLLQRLAASMPLAVLTNKPSALAGPLLEALGLTRHFAHVVGDGDGFARKPDPAAGHWLMRQHNAGPGRALVVGDGLPDVGFAQALGVPAAAVTWGYTARDRLAAEHPTWLVDAPADLLEIVFGTGQ